MLLLYMLKVNNLCLLNFFKIEIYSLYEVYYAYEAIHAFTFKNLPMHCKRNIIFYWRNG